MSSIYKKGRDGYYYYQTYLYNFKTGKKDKKIFHSLGTKVYEEALEKKKYYDSIYSKNKIKNGEGYFNTKNIFFISIILTSLITVVIVYKNSVDNSNDDVVYNSSFDPYQPNKKNINYKKDHDPLKNDSTKHLKKVPKEFVHNKIIPTSKIKKNNEELPSYFIQRVEVVDNAFNQVKINATCNDSLSQYNLKLICKDLKNIYKEYTNIIVCLYADNEIGISTAKGSEEDVADLRNEKIWLTLYSYNPVEGEYFDNNPGGYN